MIFSLDFDEDEVPPQLTLLSKDNQRIELDMKLVEQSTFLASTLEMDKNTTEIAVLGVDGYILWMIVDYLKYHKDVPPVEIEKPLREELSTIVGEWDASFIDVDRDTLFDLVNAANYLDIKPLLDLTCAKIATILNGKSSDEIKEIFSPPQ